MNLLEEIERSLQKPSVPNLKIGQTVKVHLKIVEGDKERIQVYEGVVIGKKGVGHRETVTVRKVSYGVGVERIFPLHSSTIQKIVVAREGEVSRAKLYYLRERSGRSSRLADKKREMKKEGQSMASVPPDQSALAASEVAGPLPVTLSTDSPVSAGASSSL